VAGLHEVRGALVSPPAAAPLESSAAQRPAWRVCGQRAAITATQVIADAQRDSQREVSSTLRGNSGGSLGRADMLRASRSERQTEGLALVVRSSCGISGLIASR
jgi:hypothetical protein